MDTTSLTWTANQRWSLVLMSPKSTGRCFVVRAESIQQDMKKKLSNGFVFNKLISGKKLELTFSTDKLDILGNFYLNAPDSITQTKSFSMGIDYIAKYKLAFERAVLWTPPVNLLARSETRMRWAGLHFTNCEGTL